MSPPIVIPDVAVIPATGRTVLVVVTSPVSPLNEVTIEEAEVPSGNLYSFALRNCSP